MPTNRKIPAETCREMRAWWACGGWTQAELATAWGYRVDQVTYFLPKEERGTPSLGYGGRGKSRNRGAANGRAKATPEQRADMKAWYRDGIRAWMVATGLSRGSVTAIIERGRDPDSQDES